MVRNMKFVHLVSRYYVWQARIICYTAIQLDNVFFFRSHFKLYSFPKSHFYVQAGIKIYVDGSKDKKKIQNEEDADNLKENLEKYHQWAKNHM